MQIQDRIKELRRVPASELIPHAGNWRRHPQAQRDALQGIMAEVGFTDVVLARESPDGLQLIDGHVRAEIVGRVCTMEFVKYIYGSSETNTLPGRK